GASAPLPPWRTDRSWAWSTVSRRFTRSPARAADPVSVVADAASPSAAPSLLVEHRPWWRSRVTLTAAIVGVMLVCYFALKAEYPGPASLTSDSLPTYLNDFQTWLVDQRNAESPSFVIRAFNGFADFLDRLVKLVNSFLAVFTVGRGAGGRGLVVVL